MEAFKDAARFFEESDTNQNTNADISGKMKVLLEGSNLTPYSSRHLLRILDEDYGDRIIISKVCGQRSVTSFVQTAKSILHDYFKFPQENDPEIDKMCSAEASAKIIKKEIMAVFTPKVNIMVLTSCQLNHALIFCQHHYDYFSSAFYQLGCFRQ